MHVSVFLQLYMVQRPVQIVLGAAIIMVLLVNPTLAQHDDFC